MIHERFFSCSGGDAQLSGESEAHVHEIRQILEASVEAYEIGEQRGSKALQDQIRKALDAWGAESRFAFQPVLEKPQANFELDFVKSTTMLDQKFFCGGELAFDNRQVLPTNVIKVDLAMSRLREATRQSSSLSVLITFCNDSRKFGDWDSSVATYEEYEQQLDWGIRRYLTGPLMLLGMHRSMPA